ncbi:TLD-domain-containing protein [Rhizophagus diaphanus]|nr:TLD-domain-containing protein [Rhizophagus diaphanus] [Rhizophagus sp. MUCL 43196]
MIKEIKSANIDSRIITSQHAELISRWVSRSDNTNNLTSSYRFELILRGSRDGFTHSKFHEICDNQAHTVIIIKVKDSNEVLGGYNPIGWKSDYSSVYNKDCFIFSFKKNSYILSRAKGGKINAIYNNPHRGPSFGVDLTLWGNNFYNHSYCLKFCYEKAIRDVDCEFSVEEYEVFKLFDV